MSPMGGAICNSGAFCITCRKKERMDQEERYIYRFTSLRHALEGIKEALQVPRYNGRDTDLLLDAFCYYCDQLPANQIVRRLKHRKPYTWLVKLAVALEVEIGGCLEEGLLNHLKPRDAKICDACWSLTTWLYGHWPTWMKEKAHERIISYLHEMAHIGDEPRITWDCPHYEKGVKGPCGTICEFPCTIEER